MKIFRKIWLWIKAQQRKPSDWGTMDYYERKLFTATAGMAFCIVMMPVLVVVVILLLCTQL